MTIQAALQPANELKPRSPLSHLLHALNQPLTGLQCSLELAVAGPRRAEQYIRTLREGLELTARMRLLVEAIREITDLPEEAQPVDPCSQLDSILRETVHDLGPIAETQQVNLSLDCVGQFPVRASRQRIATLTFRLLESALSLTRGGELRIAVTKEQQSAVVLVSWKEGPPLEHSPFSRPELGILIAQAGLERAGARCINVRTGDTQTCTVQFPLSSFPTFVETSGFGGLQ